VSEGSNRPRWGPPGGDWHGWRRGGWHKPWPRQRPGALFFRFLGIFGFLALLVIGGMAVLAFLFSQVFGGDGNTALLTWVAGCGLALGLPLLAVAVAVRAFRGIATPLADVMTAAEAVAGGDLSVRVQEEGPGEFSRLARSFNRMTRELERADEQRRNLTADVAHELRTPLHILQGNLEGLLDGVYQATPEQIEGMLDETRALSRLVDDLLTLSLAEAGQLQLVLADVDLEEFLADLETSFSGSAAAAGVTLRVAVEPLTGGSGLQTVRADPDRLDQVLGNLMVNALRHTPAGGEISVGAATVGEAARITVRDTGSGIAPEDLPMVFERYWRGDRTRAPGSGSGAGLGLAIARRLVEAHGGEITVESEQGHGTAFHLLLPHSGPRMETPPG
jgi:two-component system OmpR family sensor kinase/two-component system sensor histidine kinase BaeS